MFQTYNVTLQLTQLIWVSGNNRGLTQWKWKKNVGCNIKACLGFYLFPPSTLFASQSFLKYLCFENILQNMSCFFNLCCMSCFDIVYVEWVLWRSYITLCGLKAKVFMLEKMLQSLSSITFKFFLHVCVMYNCCIESNNCWIYF
jgi:hypothetical protein